MSKVINLQAYRKTLSNKAESFETVLLQLERVVFAMQLKRDKAYETLNHIVGYCKRKEISITEKHIQDHLRKILNDISTDLKREDYTKDITIDRLLEAFQSLDASILSHKTAIAEAKQHFFKKQWLSKTH